MNEVIEKLKKFAKTLDVLYVEDDEALRKQTGIFLSKFFRNIRYAGNGKAGLEKFKERDFDLVITDIKMPERDGLWMSEEIRKIDKKVPIIITSAFDEKEFLFKGMEIGVTNYLLKPIEHKIFILTLLKTLKENYLEKRVDELNTQLKDIVNYQKEMLIVIKDKKITLANKNFLDFFSFKSLKEAQLKTKSIGLSFVKEEGCFYPKMPLHWIEEISEYSDSKVKLYNSKTKEDLLFLFSNAELPNKDRVITFSDVTTILDEHKKIESDASLDPLTNTLNSYKFFSIIDSWFTHWDQKGEGSLVSIRIDNYKDIKEVYGYKDANLSLKVVSEVIKFLVPHSDISRVDEHTFSFINEHTLKESLILVNGMKKKFKEDERINGKLAVSFALTEIKKADKREKLLSRMDKFLYLAKEDKNSNVVSDFNAVVDSIENGSEELKEVIKLFISMKQSEKKLKIFNLYKGLTVSSEASIEYVGETHMIVKVSKNQLVALDYEKEASLASDSFASVIKGKIDKIDWETQRCTFSLFKREQNSFVSRKVMRVIPKNLTTISLIDSGSSVDGEIIDLSKYALAVKVENSNELVVDSDMDLNFILEAGIRKLDILLDGKIKMISAIDNQYSKIVFDIFADKENDKKLSAYITARQMEIVREFKKKGEL